MARNKEEQARLEGMAQALRIAKEKGVEGLEADLKMRETHFLILSINVTEV